MYGTHVDFWQDFNACPATANTTNLPDLVNEGSTVEHITYAPCAQNTAVELLKVTNGGHTWPGATGTSGIGNTNQDISASAEIWFFFSRFVNPIVTGLQPLQTLHQENRLHIYPNPASRYIVVRGNEFAAYNILNAMGKPVMQGTLNPMATQIDISGLAAGLYFLEVENHKTQVFNVSGIGR
ncbi:MAG TPA: T9SS type A sorting domain-containing protein [Chitinophagales bacterium]|nr:T9SS type A sorting domain-containing protein [Chitinophagales bacterium]HRK28369.1 T9SS type A sorting domain-containing protein [Chitinophagales bacterium]